VGKLHVDSIRSHAFILFTSQSAAARARAGMHDQVWPKERDRKPLWADYIPEEKVEEWIKIETTADNGPRSGTKRWEVVYEEQDGEMKPYLTEQGSQRRTAPIGRDAPSTDISLSRQVDREIPKPARPTEAPTSESFITLDKLFQSTKAKPMLYFMPVKQDLGDRRLKELDMATKRGWSSRDWQDSAELRRFTFEGDKLVDSGPHFFGARARQQQEDRLRGVRSPPGRSDRYAR
jgi:hypothetical protein